MTREEIKNTPELVDFMLDKCVLTDSRTKVRKRLEEVCDLAIKALEQEPSRDMEEIVEVIKSDVDAEIKCKMISNILTAKPHYFEVSQEPMREFTEEEAKAYSKALDKMYKPTGFNVFDEPCEEIDFVQEHKKILVTFDLMPCDDAISRRYLLDNCVVDKVTMPYVPVNKIKEAPPVIPTCEEREKGECPYYAG